MNDNDNTDHHTFNNTSWSQLTSQSTSQGQNKAIVTQNNFLQIVNLSLEQCKIIINTSPQILTFQHPYSGDSLLHLSVLKQSYPLTQFILDKNTDCNVANRLNQTPLHIAVETKNHIIINSLLEKKADSNAKDHKGDTPMHIAADNGEFKVIKLLLLFKADPMIQNARGAFPVDNAIEKRHQKCIDVLAKTRSFSDKQLILSTQNPNGMNRLNISTFNNLINDKCVSFITDNEHNEALNMISNDLYIDDKKKNCFSASAKKTDSFNVNNEENDVSYAINKGNNDDEDMILNDNAKFESHSDKHLNANSQEQNEAIQMIEKPNEIGIYYKKKCVMKKKNRSNNNNNTNNGNGYHKDKSKATQEFNSNQTNLTTIGTNSNSNSNREEKDYESFDFNISMTQCKFNVQHCVFSLNDSLETFSDSNKEIFIYKSKANDIIDSEAIGTLNKNDDNDHGIDSIAKKMTTPQSKIHPIIYSKSKEYNGYEDIDNFICNLGSPTQDMTQSPTQEAKNESEDDGIVVNDMDIFTKKESSDFLEIIEPVNLNNDQKDYPHPSSAPLSAKPTYNHDSKGIEAEIEAFLQEINMEMYAKTFLKEGFDDLTLMINQMKSGFGISDINLKEIGIKKPGHRGRILIRIQDMSNGFDFAIPDNAVYYLNPKPFKTVKYDFKVKALINWLKEIKMESFISQLYDSGYHSIELLYVQMVSKNPITESILENEIGIDKVGYRTRLLNKIQQGANAYITQLKTIKAEFITKKSINGKGCECLIC